MLGQADGGEGHRYRARSDGRIGTHLLGHGEGMLEQPAQQGTYSTGLDGRHIGFFHLAEDLRLAQNQGIESRCDAQQVTNGELFGVDIDIRFYVFAAKLVIMLEPIHHGGSIGLLDIAHNFGTIAGGEDRRLINLWD